MKAFLGSSVVLIGLLAGSDIAAQIDGTLDLHTRLQSMSRLEIQEYARRQLAESMLELVPQSDVSSRAQVFDLHPSFFPVDPFGELLMVSFVRNTTQTPIQIAMVFHTPGGSMSAPLSVELNAQERGYFYYAIPDPTLGTYTTEIRSFVKDASGEAVLIDDLVRSGSIIEEMLPNINEHMSVTRLPISYSELDYGTELEPRTGAPIPSGSTCSITVDTSGVDFVNRKSIVHFDFEEIGESVFVTDSSGNQWIRIGRPGTDGVLVVKLGEHSKRFSVSLLAAIYQSAYANAR